jgi:hypothetical protein
MRRLLSALGVAAVLSGVLAVGAGLSGAGEPAMMQAVPANSVEPATVTVSNLDDLASTCKPPDDEQLAANPSANGGVEVALNLTSTNGTTQANTVMPDASGNWSQVYTNLTVGTYTVTGECKLTYTANGVEATPSQIGPFTYEQVQFVVTAPAAAPAAPAAAAPAPVAASPTFTG